MHDERRVAFDDGAQALKGFGRTAEHHRQLAAPGCVGPSRDRSVNDGNAPERRSGGQLLEGAEMQRGVDGHDRTRLGPVEDPVGAGDGGTGLGVVVDDHRNDRAPPGHAGRRRLDSGTGLGELPEGFGCGVVGDDRSARVEDAQRHGRAHPSHTDEPHRGGLVHDIAPWLSRDSGLWALSRLPVARTWAAIANSAAWYRLPLEGVPT